MFIRTITFEESIKKMMVNYIICMRFNGATTQMNIVDNATEERIKACETNTLYTRPKMKWWNWRTYKKQSNSAFLKLQTFKAVAIPLFKRQFFPCAVNFLLHSFFFCFFAAFFFSTGGGLESHAQPKTCSHISNRKKPFLWLNSRTNLLERYKHFQ